MHEDGKPYFSYLRFLGDGYDEPNPLKTLEGNKCRLHNSECKKRSAQKSQTAEKLRCYRDSSNWI